MRMLPGQNHSWVSEFILLGFSSDPTSNRILFITFLLFYLSSVLGNGLIVTLICLDARLHTPMCFFLRILSILDMCYVTTTAPQMLVHLLACCQTIPSAACWLQMYVFGALGLTECVLFVVMAFDRYVAICYPLRYTLILSWGLCMRLAAGTWACGFLFSLSQSHLPDSLSKPRSGPCSCLVNSFSKPSRGTRSLQSHT